MLESGTPHEAGLSDDGKAGCIVRSVHTEWNMVRDVGQDGRPQLRALTPEEEVSPQNDTADRRGGMFLRSVGAEAGVCGRQERLMGMPRGHTAAPSLSASQRHALIGNSFCVPVVEQLLQPLAGLGAAVTAAGVAAAVDGLRLRAAGSAAARRWCSECESAACVFTH